MQLLYIIYNVPLSLSFSVSLLLLLSLILPISIFLCLSLCTPSLSLSLSLASLPFLLLSISVQLPPRSLVMHIINGPHKLSCSLPEKNSRVSRKFVQITITKLVYTNLLVLYCNNTNNTKLLDFFTYLTCTKLKSNFKYSVKEIIFSTSTKTTDGRWTDRQTGRRIDRLDYIDTAVDADQEYIQL